MRDPARIERIAGKLARVWATLPDQRLGQLVWNLNPSSHGDVFHIEDDEWEAAIDAELRYRYLQAGFANDDPARSSSKVETGVEK